MADVSAPSANVPDTTAPGRLTMADSVFEKIALAAALSVDGVVRHDGSMAGRLGAFVGGEATAGSDYPRVRVESAGGAAHVVDLTLALAWPSPISATCSRVRQKVGDELDRLTGNRPVRVNVAVEAVVPGAAARFRKNGFVQLPDPDDGPAAGEAVDEGGRP
ncbi:MULTISPECIES: Asp23/Gls24 family envelope stress response protein [Gordonia]|uniref:Asp23/Gls24 family envelope stress response protein n=2 Tax=Gordonia TaxID=2053 RepID=L7LK80_9ACTN|nr:MULTISPECIES: Asp23/Gls24 family envelope stress response protein [Gordonia]KJR07246.1 hypothetical protein UG54_11345 [Gordonia sihwensis]KXT57201.1 hypothetical protein Y710_08810 [Gordonia sp. QH-12]MBY4568693.1 hypothetical protein [Gordonia sihwensis]WFN92745.1 Asp23/Gls24 family envelope stress response protein [Gordonia sihwensis]GAC61530.1 hypothetical protein GSI01S_18_00910 [Gordonia sihwensis NBRC 108236]